ncbi:hypothetical protein Pmar_PMAR015524 [Perkinsus marinus ATCC 50983]|uniref:Peptidase A1 domain-containing protein n=1 Tax=Perkinsus marinus (strain ATCC 50983 / TXsc) TaxID=423536 RepID=C5LNA3_PERM5|nr:hypothetical protein Pmar_PMAR015524 [Perkinsus marinus ATCC 50983]EER01782.1 hypothetical protein Pmar_PMAR015524 [Perkinsus marinus ATCC 50983]|eukprot:XP_002769064.1 hypothetical protein Pmar_PMAR015524 [Perkinsus marinus ATCC 50983]
MINTVSSALIVASFLGKCWAEKLIRMSIFVQKEDALTNPGDLMTNLKVDGEDVTVLVDTGSPFTYFVWRHWYESTNPGGCEKIIYKCYECNPAPCHEGPKKHVKFIDGTYVNVFFYSGKVNFGSFTASGIDFGLLAGTNGGASAALGLAPRSPSAKPYVPLINQLLALPKSERPIEKSIFSVYLNAASHPTGELILGGQDKSKYIGSLKYMKVNMVEETVKMSGLGIGDVAKHRIRVSAEGHVDTGCNYIGLPERLKGSVLKLLATVGDKPVKIEENSGVYEVSCGDAKYLPPITFFVKGTGLFPSDVSIEVLPSSYVVQESESSCFLAILFDDMWILGLPTVFGHYYLYDWEKSRIGVAKSNS